MNDQRKRLLIGVVLMAGTVLVYGQLIHADFIPYDDQAYVTENSVVRGGLTWSGARWALSDIHTGYWHPLTWLSLMLDYELYGLHAGGYHVTNVIFHILNTILLFLVFSRLTGSPWRSGVVAALFALHPLHVESVAWVAERKDVLSGFFWMLAMCGYVRYVERPGVGRYFLVLVLFILGLMSKPMLVTLPFVLLLLDVWPLGRCRWGESEPGGGVSLARLIGEKVPLFVLAIGISVWTYLAARQIGAVADPQSLSMGVRIANASSSYILYIWKMIWPANLAVFYPYSELWPLWKLILSVLVIFLISAIAFRQARTYPYIIVGWLWYLGTLIPTIGIIQAGAQAMADRYTYIPMVGLFIIMTWGFSDLTRRWHNRRVSMAMLTLLVLSLMSIVTWHQTHYWQRGESLLYHALAVTKNNYIAHSGLGEIFLKQNRYREAVQQYQAALKAKPNYEKAWYGLGVAQQYLGNHREAISSFTQALSVEPRYAAAHYALADAFSTHGSHHEAFHHYRAALRYAPEEVELYNRLGNLSAHQGRWEEALHYYREGLRRQPDHAGFYNNIGMVLLRQDRAGDAEQSFRSAVRLRPEYAHAHFQLSCLLRSRGLSAQADRHFEAAVRINPDFSRAVCNVDRRSEAQ